MSGRKPPAAAAPPAKQTPGAFGRAPPKGGDDGVIYIGHIPHGFYEDQMTGARRRSTRAAMQC